jgi:hypothetical protein
VDLDANLRIYLDGDIKPNDRYASFDYCFNYFQSFRGSGQVCALASRTNVQKERTLLERRGAAVVRNLPACLLCTRPRFRMRSYSVRSRSDCAVQDWELGRRPLWTRADDGFWR